MINAWSLWDVWEIIVNIIEISLVFFFFTRALSNYKQSRIKTFVGAVCMLVYLSTINLSGIFSGEITTFLSLIGYLSYVLIAFKGHLLLKIICGFIPTFVIVIADFLTFTIATALNIDNLEQLILYGPVRFNIQLLYLTICAILYLLAMIIFAKSTKQKPVSYFTLIFIVFLLALGILVINFLIDILIIAAKNGLPAELNIYVTYIGLTFIILFVSFVVFQWRLNFVKQKQLDAELKLQHRQMLDNCNASTMASVDKMKKLRHDTMNNMSVIKALLDSDKSDEASRYLAEIYGVYEKEINIANYTKDEMVNAVLSAKREIAVDKNISVRYSVEKLDSLPISKHDMCSLIGNLLDNAIEACEREYDHDNLFIDLFIRVADNSLNIIVKNKFTGRLKIQGDNIISKKRISGRSLGLSIIKDIVKQAEGVFDYSIDREDGIFEASILIPY